MPRQRRTPPFPPGFRTVTPYLAVSEGSKALEFYAKAFGAKEIPSSRQQTSDGKIIHARFKIGNSLMMLSDQFGADTVPSPPGATPVTFHIYARDVDMLWKRAVSAGAKVVMPLGNQYWGEKYGQLIDPFGHKWSLSMQVKISKREQEAKRKEAMAMFARNEHPSKTD